MRYDEGLIPLFSAVQYGQAQDGESNAWAQWQYRNAFTTQMPGTGQYGRQYSQGGGVGPALSPRQPGTWPIDYPPGVLGTMSSSVQELSYMLEPGVVQAQSRAYGYQIPPLIPRQETQMNPYMQMRSARRGAQLRGGSYPAIPKLPPPVCGYGQQLVQTSPGVYACVPAYEGACPGNYQHAGFHGGMPVCRPITGSADVRAAPQLPGPPPSKPPGLPGLPPGQVPPPRGRRRVGRMLGMPRAPRIKCKEGQKPCEVIPGSWTCIDDDAKCPGDTITAPSRAGIGRSRAECIKKCRASGRPLSKCQRICRGEGAVRNPPTALGRHPTNNPRLSVMRCGKGRPCPGAMVCMGGKCVHMYSGKSFGRRKKRSRNPERDRLINQVGRATVATLVANAVSKAIFK